MNWAGFGIFILSICLSTIVVVCNKFIRKITNCYLFWLPIAIFCFLWIFCWRTIPCWQAYMNALINNKLNDPSNYFQSRIISDAFLFQTCLFTCLLIPLALIFDPSRKVARLFAPITILGAVISLMELMWRGSATFSLHYIFIGVNDNRCYVFYHLSALLLSIGVLLNTPKLGTRGQIGVLACFVLYAIYIFIGTALSGCRWSCSGLLINDYKEHGVYYQERIMFEKLFSCTVPDVVCPIIGTGITVGLNALVVLINDKVFKHFKWFNYGNARNEKSIIWKFKKKTITLPWWCCWYDYNKFIEVESLKVTIKNWFNKIRPTKKHL